MKKIIELLAPGGDMDSIKAAIIAGADAVYCGLAKFNARNRAANISFDDLNGILGFAHKNNCQVFLTLNIIITESEIPALIGLLNKLVNTSIDGIIVQDLGVFYLVSHYFKSLKIHASTQLTTHNKGQILFLNKLTATRVNLSRELNVEEIKDLTLKGHDHNVLIEVFVHGSNCISFSGICYCSSVHGGNSGNRGRCSQPCRDQYVTTPKGKSFPLNLKDNSAFSNLKELSDAGIDSIKIEGRIKKSHYVYTVVNAWRKQLQLFYDDHDLIKDHSSLYKVFNRDFSNAFLTGSISKDMFIDNPRDHSAIHLSEKENTYFHENIEKAKNEIYEERTDIIIDVEAKLSQFNIGKCPLIIVISGECGNPLKVLVKTPETSFVVCSEMNLTSGATQLLNEASIRSRLNALNDTEYYIKQIDLKDLQSDLFIPFKELTSIKRRLLFILNGSKEFANPIAVPFIKKSNTPGIKPTLFVLLSSKDDLHLCNETSATIFLQLPSCFKDDVLEFIELFRQNRKVIPWFPSVLIGKDYDDAIEFLRLVQPELIVTNNSGIAYEAYEKGIKWIAGPHLNIVNSFSLLNLKENFNCSGSFISNEINKGQIKGIKKPEDFDLYYSIYHPIVLMTSRQCLFHQVSGCGKDKIDGDCIKQCEKTAEITNLKQVSFVIEKSKGNYHYIYNETNFLNTEIVTDIPNLFSGYLIDLRDIKTGTKLDMEKRYIIDLFENLLNDDPESKKKLVQVIYPTLNTQYIKGI
jgi:U32 family peptidase